MGGDALAVFQNRLFQLHFMHFQALVVGGIYGQKVERVYPE